MNLELIKFYRNILKYFYQRIYYIFLLFNIKSLKSDDHKLIVSLTSQPSRINTCWISILSIFNQDFINFKIILVLSKLEFPLQKIPWTLKILQKKGLVILWIKENYKSYNKLIPVRLMFPLSKVVTFDDDVIYERWRLKILYQKSTIEPSAIIGFRGKKLKRDINKIITPYLSWNEEALIETDSLETLLTGVGGILYPPNNEFDDLITNYNLAKDLAPTADDIFFWGVSFYLNIRRISLGFHHKEDIVVFKKSAKLCDINNSEFNNKNDIAIQKVTSYFNI